MLMPWRNAAAWVVVLAHAARGRVCDVDPTDSWFSTAIPSDCERLELHAVRSMPALATAVAAAPPSLRELALRLANVTEADATALASALSAGLERVDLWHNHVRDAGAEVLAAALEASPTSALATLYITDNEVSDAGAAALARATGRLETLGLGGNAIGDAGAAALADGLRNGSRLRALGLSANRVSDAGARALADALCAPGGAPALASLSLARNRVGDAGAKALARALGDARGCAPALRELHLWDAELGDAGAAALAERALARLRALHLARNAAVGDRAAAVIAHALRENCLLYTSPSPRDGLLSRMPSSA